MTATVLILGLAILFQFVIIRIKYHKQLYADIVVDIGMLLLLNVMFGGTILGSLGATAGSVFISLYLIYKPISISFGIDSAAFVADIKQLFK